MFNPSYLKPAAFIVATVVSLGFMAPVAIATPSQQDALSQEFGHLYLAFDGPHQEKEIEQERNEYERESYYRNSDGYTIEHEVESPSDDTRLENATEELLDIEI